MKTTNVLLTALVVMFASVAAFAADPGTPKLVVVNQKSGVFKVIYEGSKTGKVSLKIFNSEMKEVFSEVHTDPKGFILPVNFGGMEFGEYTLQITDVNGVTTRKVNYTVESAPSRVHVAKMTEGSKYLMAIANKGPETFTVKIFDGANNLVHTEDINVNGDYGVVYNLKQITGTPTFEVYNKAGLMLSK